MTDIIPVLFGVVQGLTEFIPVSSSGHLVILHAIFSEEKFADAVAFDVALHVGTLASLLIYFRKDCYKYLAAWFTSWSYILKNGRRAGVSMNVDQRLAWYICLAIVPAGLVGFFFENIIDTWLRSPWIVVVMLVLVALLFLWIERRGNAAFVRKLDAVRMRDALFIGSMQVLALIPGTSRSGITIISGMMAGLTRATAARFSFLISIPLIAAAGLKKGLDLATMGLDPSEFPSFVSGVLASSIVGYIAISFLLKFLERRSLRIFAWYRIVLAIIVSIVFILI
ncbi:MAG: undecaprenyl-diphosphatase UppP [Candidatus Kerfeldbacteria bacterium CG15_BIG_FIL_POST_REV_8_21_14_020_45_12]|uniref:Undecaprenyl-diphosphatase n=1 Tax=Candidatus Kerfeldbacteria bacterium CG15_BIG_FIL_POST_REV_8_21_14_020_45_12 TaxID=2014247 RepID=A0A2M7H471_9BACT|nr:MAG: undecaprenyl-diphosphatase UppP [Candidatus Kerfeldbacteria bacterium CG15_BIG_FIL_POST_REV_8_21_14_020_45_12]PJA92988.1 MAG: undecaprenyl-diphosphatase UppP [Candidatus Kerfeldbacteria bacterium CG_4_9_14_3_um_filter_45_8]